MKKKRLFLKIIVIFVVIGILVSVLCFGLSAYVVNSSRDKVVEKTDGFDADCITVLGAKVRDGQPSLMLRDRLDRAIEIYFNTGIPLLMSGDCSDKNYNEVEVMKNYAVFRGVPEEDIYTDPEGYSTLETVTRIENFGFESTVIVTQRYHLYRALYICEKADIDATGVAAADIQYHGETYRLLREVAARTKDFFYTLFIA